MKFKNYEKVIFYILILFVSFILVFNIFNYDPIQGYDAEAHHEYINNFSMFIPGKSDSLTSSLQSILAHRYHICPSNYRCNLSRYINIKR